MVLAINAVQSSNPIRLQPNHQFARRFFGAGLRPELLALARQTMDRATEALQWMEN